MQFQLPDACARVFEQARGAREHALGEDLGALQPSSFWLFCATDTQAKKRAGDEARTRDVHLGKVVLYQLSYTRSFERDNNVQPTAPRNLLIAPKGPKSLNPNWGFTAS